MPKNEGTQRTVSECHRHQVSGTQKQRKETNSDMNEDRTEGTRQKNPTATGGGGDRELSPLFLAKDYPFGRFPAYNTACFFVVRKYESIVERTGRVNQEVTTHCQYMYRLQRFRQYNCDRCGRKNKNHWGTSKTAKRSLYYCPGRCLHKYCYFVHPSNWRRPTIQVHPKFSEAPRFRSSKPLPEN